MGFVTMKHALCAAALAAAFLATPASAQIAAPELDYGKPATIDPAARGTLSLTVYGDHIDPDYGNHPDWHEYYHIFVRKIAASGAVGGWTHCDYPVGCSIYSSNMMQVTFRIDASRWGVEEGSALQLRYYTGLDDANGSDPHHSIYGQALSDWSNVFTWKVMTDPPPPPPEPIELVRKANLRPPVEATVGRSTLPVMRPGAPRAAQVPDGQAPLLKPIIKRPPQVVPHAP